jgi:LacI family transcriptional regulator
MTIKEFAHAIGVSPATVSRALHGRGRISETTREMVLRRMEELAYTPNHNAQRLVGARTSIVALEFRGTPPLLTDFYFTQLTQGVQEALQARDCGLLLAAPGGAVWRWVSSRAVDGVVLVGGEGADYDAARRIAGRAPCVIIGHHPVNAAPNLGSVFVDLRGGARQVARVLTDRGHRRIAFLGGQSADAVLTEFRSALRQAGASLSPELAVRAGRTIEDGFQAMDVLLAGPVPPTAVFARRDALALGALAAARRRGLRVPEDLSIVGHDDVPQVRLTEPPLSSVRVDCSAVGAAAVEILFQLLPGPERPPCPAALHTELVDRGSISIPPPPRHPV